MRFRSDPFLTLSSNLTVLSKIPSFSSLGNRKMTAHIISRPDGSGNDIWREVLTALGLSIGAAVALGFSRFAYGLLLPPMRADLGWTFAQAGALNTANGAGYIVGALVAAWTAKRWGTSRVFTAGFLVSVLVLLATAAATSL